MEARRKGKSSGPRSVMAVRVTASLLYLLCAAPATSYTPEFADGTGWLSTCYKYTVVFGIPACFTKRAWETSAEKCAHVANVMAQLLDNDEDGAVDDRAVVDEMRKVGSVLWVPATDAESEEASFFSVPWTNRLQMTGLWEATINSCMVPSFRGASQTNRNTWAAVRQVGAGSMSGASCDPNRDATFEEMLHLITEAASTVYPEQWGQTSDSEAGAALFQANGNCGFGYSGDYQDPAGTECTGTYAYNDDTCDLKCVVVEGIYWAIASYTGALYTDNMASFAQNEWLMVTPDNGMPLLPANVANAATLQSGSPGMYSLVSGSASHQAWVPTRVPDGNYSQSLSGGTMMPPPAPLWGSIVGGITGVSVALFFLCVLLPVLCCKRRKLLCFKKGAHKMDISKASGVAHKSHA